MSKLLDDLIKQSRADTAAYEKFLRRRRGAGEATCNQSSPTADVPAVLHGRPEAIVLFNNLASIPATTFQCPTDDDEKAALALKLDVAMRENAPAGWKGRRRLARSQVLNALFPLMATGSHRDAGDFRHHQEPTGLLMTETIQLGELSIRVTRKDIKNVHLSVHPPDGRVTLTAPDRDAAGRRPRLRHLESSAGFESSSKSLTNQARETPRQLHRARESLPLGTAAT